VPRTKEDLGKEYARIMAEKKKRRKEQEEANKSSPT